MQLAADNPFPLLAAFGTVTWGERAGAKTRVRGINLAAGAGACAIGFQAWEGTREKPAATTNSWWAASSFGFTGREHDLDSSLVYARARYLNPGTGRWDRPDPAGMIDGPGLYAYVSGSPASLRDPHGLFITSLHREMTLRALSAYASPDDILLLQRAQDIADSSKYQTEEYAYRHAMSAPGQTQAQAHDQWWNFVIFELYGGAYWENQAPCGTVKNPHEVAMLVLGKGMHAVQDFFSPSHYGFQTWYDPSKQMNAWPGALSHMAREDFMTLRSPEVIEAMGYTVKYYQAFKTLSKMPVISTEMALAVFGNELWYEGLWSYTGAE